MTIGTILIIVLILLLMGVIPAWSHGRSKPTGPGAGDRTPS